ncbi:MAG: TolB family protein [Dysgonomonas sp.]
MRNKSLLSIALLLFCGGTLLAQPKVAGEPKAIVKADQPMMNPTWSPDGKQLAVTSIGNDGIWVVDANGKNLRQVTSDAGAGYKMSWSADNKTILGRTSIRENNRVFHEVKTYDVVTNSSRLIESKTRQLKGVPFWSSDYSQVVYQTENGTKSAKSGIRVVNMKSKVASSAEALFSKMVADPATVAADVAGLNQFKGKVLFNPVVSPDGNKIAFQVGGEGLYVCDADGNQLKALGKGERATWTPDGKYVIAAVTTDDGHELTGGKLVSANVESGAISTLMSSGYIAVSPAVSPDGKKLAFEDYASGYVYLVDLKY